MISEQTISTVAKYRKNNKALVFVSNKWKETVKYYVVYQNVNNIEEHVHYRLHIISCQLDEKYCDRVYSLDLNWINNIPEKVWLMKRLQILKMCGTPYLNDGTLKGLSESIGQLVQLRKLTLGGYHLTELPESIGQLVQLWFLDLRDNCLNKLPESICQLTRLQYFNVARNQLRELPESIGKLTRLQYFIVGSNRLMELPESIGKLSQLRFIGLKYNSLKTLQKSIGGLEQLQEIEIEIDQFQSTNIIKYLLNTKCKYCNSIA